MRIPLGWLTDRHRRPARVQRADGVHAAAAGRARALARLAGADPRRSGSCSASPAPRSPSASRSSTAGTRPSARASRSGIYGMGMGGTVLAGLTAPRIADHWGLSAPFWVATGADGRDGRRLPRARPRRAARRRGPVQRRACSPPCRCSAPAAAHGRSRSFTSWPSAASSPCSSTCPSCSPASTTSRKADAGARAAGFALLAVIGRPLGGWLSDRVGADRVLLVSFIGVAVLALVLAVAYTAMVPLTIACLTMAVALGLGTGAVFKLVPRMVPRPRRRGHRRRRRRRRTRRLLPPARHGRREVRHRRLRARLRPNGARRARLPHRSAAPSARLSAPCSTPQTISTSR